MAARPHVVLVLLAALSSLGATYRTQQGNFIVEAPTPAIAEQVGQYAEYYRREKAMQWLGQEMPPWPEPCPLRVTISVNENGGGATSFAFDRGHVLGQYMQIEGSLNRVLASVLPHEVTHTVFAYYFRQPLPRWADEGGAVLSEDELERQNHDALVRRILNTPGRAIPLRRLFPMREYPKNDVMALYAEGFSVTNFLVGQSNRQQFLAFVNHGMYYGWDDAARKYYSYKDVNDLEQAWLKNLRDTKRQPATMLASERGGETPAEPTSRVTVRQTLPPAQPLLEEPQPQARGQGPDDFDDRLDRRATAMSRPQYLPDYRTPSMSASPAPTGMPQPSTARLGLPQADARPPTVQLGQPVAPPPYAYQR
jgi:hypothetical protein